MAAPKKIPPLAEEVLKTLRLQGTRFNIVTPVDYRWEVHYQVRKLDGTDHIHFVCEIDSYGNITDEGPYFREEGRTWKDRGVILNADNEVVYDETKKAKK